MSTGICAVCIFVDAPITALANAVAAISRRATSRPQDRQARGKGRAVVAGVPGDRLEEIAHRQLLRPCGVDDVAGKHVRDVPFAPADDDQPHLRPRDPPQDGDLGGRRLAVDQPDRDNGVSAGREPTITAPASPPVVSASASSEAPSPGDRDLGQRAFESARLTDERHDLTDAEPERHQRNPSLRPRA